jgi:hypothetical protein
MLEWVPAGLNTGALSGAKASSSRTRDKVPRYMQVLLIARSRRLGASKLASPVSNFPRDIRS